MSEQRKLTTIMAVDVAGYSRAAEADESAAADTVRRVRSVIDEIVAPLGGRIFNTAGDGFMVELPTASAGVEAATQLLAARDAPQVRIGLHLGEVIVSDNGDLLGHGVNVAARLQQMAEPGSALVSQAVQTQIRDGRIKLAPLGKVQLDKMHDRIDVFALSTVGGAKSFRRVFWRRTRRALIALLVVGVLGVGGYAAWRMYGPQQAAETPRLAVLRFETIGETEPHFAETLADELITQASRVQGLAVVARASSFALEGADASPQGAARELHATMVLTGSVRRVDDRVRVVALLAEAPGGRQIWSEQFERPLSEIYILQNQIAARVAQSVGLRALPPPRRVDPDAYDFYVRGREVTSTEPEAAISLFEEAVRRDPQFAGAWARLGTARGRVARQRWLMSPPGTAIEASWYVDAFAALDRAIELDPGAPFPYETRSSLLATLGRWHEALEAADQAAERGGGNATIYSFLGYTQRGESATRSAIVRDPLNADRWLNLGQYCKFAGDLACAIDAFEHEFRINPNQAPFYLALALHRAGRNAEALALTRTGETYWVEVFDTPDSAPLTLDLIRAILGEGEVPPSDQLLATLDHGGYPDNLIDVFIETNRAADAARILPRWTAGSRPSLPLLFDFPLAPMRARPEFWDLMEREGILDVWREVGPPDFCAREPVCEPYLGR